MRVTCHRDDADHAAAAGHLVVTEDAEAIYFYEAPDDEIIEAMTNAPQKIIIDLDDCTAETDFASWAAGFFAHKARHSRRTRAGFDRAVARGYSPQRFIPAKTELFVLALLEMGLSMKGISRKVGIDVKTVRRVRDDRRKNEK